MLIVVLYLAAWLGEGNLHLTLDGYWLQEICGTELHVTGYKGVKLFFHRSKGASYQFLWVSITNLFEVTYISRKM